MADTPTVDDLSVYDITREDDSMKTYEVRSGLTRGRCATIYAGRTSDYLHIAPFLIPSYMQGITEGLILEAYRKHLAAGAQRGTIAQARALE